MPLESEMQRAFLARYLGVDLGPTTTPLDPAGLVTLWRDAKDHVDGQMVKLRGALLADEDPELRSLADTGLFALGKSENVALMNALFDLRGADESTAPKLRRNVVTAAANYAQMITGNELIALVDDNPFGVNVAMRATLGNALATIIKELR